MIKNFAFEFFFLRLLLAVDIRMQPQNAERVQIVAGLLIHYQEP